MDLVNHVIVRKYHARPDEEPRPDTVPGGIFDTANGPFATHHMSAPFFGAREYDPFKYNTLNVTRRCREADRLYNAPQFQVACVLLPRRLDQLDDLAPRPRPADQVEGRVI